MASSRQIFVGNIPYDATEEQVKAVCEEVGPVVSFNFITDKETGRPKGFGFCEFKDEATALSALRNLQGCELNGRKLKFNFAMNNRGNQQPVGLLAAVDAAAAMAGAMGGSQQQAFATDPLTVCLSNMTRKQLAQMIGEMKGMAEEDKEAAQDFLRAKPQLREALLQAQIMLGMVTPKMMQNIKGRQESLPQPQLVPISEPVQVSEPQVLPSGVDPDMLKQMLSLPPEKLAHLPPEIRQEVIRFQEMYGHGR